MVSSQQSASKTEMLCSATNKGRLVSATEADDLAKEYGENISSRYLFYFSDQNKKLCVDATKSNCMARYVNDSPQCFSNCRMVIKHDGEMPHLCLVASKDIDVNEELRYDYGDKGKYLPWRKSSKYLKPLKFSLEVQEKLKKQKAATASNVLGEVLSATGEFKKTEDHSIPPTPEKKKYKKPDRQTKYYRKSPKCRKSRRVETTFL